MGPKLVDFGVSVDLDVAYFDIQGLKSRPQMGPFWTHLRHHTGPGSAGLHPVHPSMAVAVGGPSTGP